MHALNLVTLLLIIIGGISWLFVGLFQFDLVATLFGGQEAILSRIVYVLVGLSAVYQLIPFSRAISIGEPAAEGSLGHRH
ncbi:DUF378 domain-containing protein [Rhizobium sp. LC145]|uniref:DUF378 domain-containing protein n=1 Tax=Rhizobium sp. LC145 TaxID=1120688 RepID=UPI00062A25B6|nr:DUF378 domain-containing protein [Rhizobium sp. LC145]KKX26175.1 hypothetical protein YH62_24075 [Rhizobium sp. LC145]TKT67112.1 DUF378 domain-containing protein [Rhizobiaceae bacterium LC148]